MYGKKRKSMAEVLDETGQDKADVSQTAVKLRKKHQLLVLLQRHVGHMDSLVETNGGFVCSQC